MGSEMSSCLLFGIRELAVFEGGWPSNRIQYDHSLKAYAWDFEMIYTYSGWIRYTMYVDSKHTSTMTMKHWCKIISASSCRNYWNEKLRTSNINTDCTRSPGKLPREVNIKQKVGTVGKNQLRYKISYLSKTYNHSRSLSGAHKSGSWQKRYMDF
jgi:hypothetical protein